MILLTGATVVAVSLAFSILPLAIGWICRTLYLKFTRRP